MYDEELRRVSKVVDNLIKENFFSTKQVCLFGSSNDIYQVTVKFDSVGQRSMYAGFAKLKKL